MTSHRESNNEKEDTRNIGREESEREEWTRWQVNADIHKENRNEGYSPTLKFFETTSAHSHSWNT